MLEPKWRDYLTTFGLGLAITVAILGTVFALAATVLNQPLSLALMSFFLLIGGIAVRIYNAN